MLRTSTLLVLLLTGCATGISASKRAQWDSDAQAAVTALQGAQFEDALRLSDEALTKDKDNSRAAAVGAIARYRKTAHDLVGDVTTLVASFVASAMLRGDVVNQDFLDFALGRADQRLQAIDALLATAEKDQGFSLDLCMACWQVDWNRSGEVDDRDEHLFEVEYDADGQLLPLDDPRRRPTFRFDVADVTWLRAMLHFQRAVLAVGLAYDANVTWKSRRSESITLKLRNGAKLAEARELILSGLTHAERCRLAVLAETDDEREWVPNPKQKQHALPLPVDDALFETWAGVLTDVRALVKGEQGLDVAALAQLGDHKWKNAPPGFLDLGAFFSQPRDFTVSSDMERSLRRNADPGLASETLGRLLGPSYKASMPPSPLIERLGRMAKELDRGEDTFERKLRYLLWLN
ncbi:MAG: hypothetical protein QM817_37635 [Archangium sp.]